MHLDDDQEVIANHEDGHALVLAGAGSGKTTCIVERCFRRIKNGIPPQKILMMTFTNKAAKEMRERLEVKLKDYYEGGQFTMPTITTYHSFGHRLIQKYPEAHLRQPGITIMSEGEIKAMLKTLTEAVASKDAARRGIDAYEMMRNEGLDPTRPQDEKAIFNIMTTHDIYEQREVLSAWQAYEKEKQFQNIIDFGDLINLPIYALRNSPDLRHRLNDYLIDITIDESQDNNKSQYKMLKLLASPDGFQSVVMIGDDDQSIHRWRGAEPDNLQTFQDEYQPSLYLLENNYRSQPIIVDSATKVIRNNRKRMEKNPRATLEQTSKGVVKLMEYPKGEDMTRFLVKKIKDDLEKGVQPKDIAVLYRTNKMAHFLEEHFLVAGIPYSVKKGTEILDSTECKLMIAAARLAINERDQQAFLRLSDIIPGLGKKKVEDLFDSLKEGESIFSKVDQLKGKAKEETDKALGRIRLLSDKGPKVLSSWMKQQAVKDWLEKKAETAVKQEFKEEINDGHFGEGDMKREKAARLQHYWRNIESVQKTINVRIDEMPAGSEPIDQWLEALDVVLRPPEDEYEPNKVTLCTAHSAKGLEWKIVHIAGFSDGLMPLTFESKNEGSDTVDDVDMTEERCLAYVAMTRAKEQLYLHHAKRMDLMNGQGNRFYQISRFYDESGLGLKNTYDHSPSWSPRV